MSRCSWTMAWLGPVSGNVTPFGPRSTSDCGSGDSVSCRGTATRNVAPPAACAGTSTCSLCLLGELATTVWPGCAAAGIWTSMNACSGASMTRRGFGECGWPAAVSQAPARARTPVLAHDPRGIGSCPPLAESRFRRSSSKGGRFGFLVFVDVFGLLPRGSDRVHGCSGGSARTGHSCCGKPVGEARGGGGARRRPRGLLSAQRRAAQLDEREVAGRRKAEEK